MAESVEEGVAKRTTYTKVKLTNVSDGPKGIFGKNGQVVLDPGETKEVELDEFEKADLPDYFKEGEPPPTDEKPPEETQPIQPTPAPKK